MNRSECDTHDGRHAPHPHSRECRELRLPLCSCEAAPQTSHANARLASRLMHPWGHTPHHQAGGPLSHAPHCTHCTHLYCASHMRPVRLRTSCCSSASCLLASSAAAFASWSSRAYSEDCREGGGWRWRSVLFNKAGSKALKPSAATSQQAYMHNQAPETKRRCSSSFSAGQALEKPHICTYACTFMQCTPSERQEGSNAAAGAHPP